MNMQIEISGALLFFLYIIVIFLAIFFATLHNSQKKKYEQELKITIHRCDEKIKETIESCNRSCAFFEAQKDSAEQMQFAAEDECDTLFNLSKSNLRTIPYFAGIIADFETHGFEKLALSLEWGSDQNRLKKVKSIREIRADARAMVEKNKEAQYQLEYLLNLFPALRDVIETEYNDLPIIQVDALSNHDATRDYLSKEEYAALSTRERNQLALDRYIASHHKSKWQIGRDYELFVGYKYEQKGYSVNYFGSFMGMEDLGRDLIAKKDGKTLIIQCKYWSTKKEIHENHVNQLYGTLACFCIENNLPKDSAKGILVTNITLSDMARKMADYLGIEYVENFEMGDFPRIKCNISYDELGIKTKIYHLPFDQQYDSTKIDQNGEFMALTVEEAEKAGFRRALRWFGQ